MDIDSYRTEIEAALVYAGGSHTYDDVKAEVEAGTLQFWPGVRSVLITGIVEYPRRKVLSIFLAGGVLDEIEAMLPVVLAWGREQGCSSATAIGRRGWTRTFVTAQGWTANAVLYEKELE